MALFQGRRTSRSESSPFGVNQRKCFDAAPEALKTALLFICIATPVEKPFGTVDAEMDSNSRGTEISQLGQAELSKFHADAEAFCSVLQFQLSIEPLFDESECLVFVHRLLRQFTN